MDWHRRSIRMGALVIALAVLLRLYGTGTLEAVGAALAEPAVASFLLYLETGRVVRPVPEPEETEPQPTEPGTQTEPPQPIAFSASDAELVYVRGTDPEKVDVEALLTAPLDLDLTGDAPTVLILHTHATESYTRSPGEDYRETSAYRTVDTDYNMVSIGARVEELLEAAGIGVVRSEVLHDYPEYTGGYGRSGATAEEYLAQYPSIRVILDLHRDAAVDSNGNQFDSSAKKDGQESAQLMLLMSNGNDGWQQNMNLAVKVVAQLEKMYPGITRGILTRNGHYNQHLCPGAMLVEVGAAGNTREEALRAAEALAEALIALSEGTE